jgi:hypothetical protein
MAESKPTELVEPHSALRKVELSNKDLQRLRDMYVKQIEARHHSCAFKNRDCDVSRIEIMRRLDSNNSLLTTFDVFFPVHRFFQQNGDYDTFISTLQMQITTLLNLSLDLFKYAEETRIVEKEVVVEKMQKSESELKAMEETVRAFAMKFKSGKISQKDRYLFIGYANIKGKFPEVRAMMNNVWFEVLQEKLFRDGEEKCIYQFEEEVKKDAQDAVAAK